jgi:tetrahydromethanopterin S-methyltransferase subunit D
MQKYTKLLTGILAWVFIGPFIAIGFIVATVIGSYNVGGGIAEEFWDRLSDWVRKND